MHNGKSLVHLKLTLKWYRSSKMHTFEDEDPHGSNDETLIVYNGSPP